MAAGNGGARSFSGATARDPETRQLYIRLAKDWWEIARQGDQLEADLKNLARKAN